MSDKPTESELWEAVGALAGYTPADPPPDPRLDCPHCGSPIDGASRAPRWPYAMLRLGYDQHMVIGAPEDAVLDPCGHRMDWWDFERLCARYEAELKRAAAMTIQRAVPWPKEWM